MVKIPVLLILPSYTTLVPLFDGSLTYQLLVVLVSIVQSQAALFSNPALNLTPLLRLWGVGGACGAAESSLQQLFDDPWAQLLLTRTRPQPSNLRSIYFPVSRAALCYPVTGLILTLISASFFPPFFKLSLLTNPMASKTKHKNRRQIDLIFMKRKRRQVCVPEMLRNFPPSDWENADLTPHVNHSDFSSAAL